LQSKFSYEKSDNFSKRFCSSTFTSNPQITFCAYEKLRIHQSVVTFTTKSKLKLFLKTLHLSKEHYATHICTFVRKSDPLHKLHGGICEQASDSMEPLMHDEFSANGRSEDLKRYLTERDVFAEKYRLRFPKTSPLN